MKSKIIVISTVLFAFLLFFGLDLVKADSENYNNPCNTKSENWSTPVCPTIPEDTIPEDTTPEETVPEDTTPEDSYPLDTVAPSTTVCTLGDRICSGDVTTTTVCTLGDRLCSELLPTTTIQTVDCPVNRAPCDRVVDIITGSTVPDCPVDRAPCDRIAVIDPPVQTNTTFAYASSTSTTRLLPKTGSETLWFLIFATSACVIGLLLYVWFPQNKQYVLTEDEYDTMLSLDEDR